VTHKSKYVTDFTTEELIVVCLAREMKDDEVGIQGAATPFGAAAVQLARLTHAKGLMYYCMNGWDPQVYTLNRLADYLQTTQSSICIPDLEDMVSAIQRGKLDFEVVRPGQIDQFGNMNNSVIGDHKKPVLRFPGAIGVPDTTCFVGRLIVYHPRHSTRVFVEKVDFVSSFGHPPGGAKKRKALGIIGGGPRRVISNLAVFCFDEETGRIKLETIHPGVSMEELMANTGFDLMVSGEIPETEPPTEEQIEILRTEIAPHGLRKIGY
jgi:glutaconate CoA-transferase subunit B